MFDTISLHKVWKSWVFANTKPHNRLYHHGSALKLRNVSPQSVAYPARNFFGPKCLILGE